VIGKISVRRSPRVMHVIASLDGYGAEGFVARLVPLLAAGGTEVAALTVYSGKNPTPTTCEGAVVFDAARAGRADAGFFPRMVSAMRCFRPDIVHTHMHNGKYWGRLAAVAAGVPYIVHTEHNSEFARGFQRAAAAALASRTARFVAFSRGHAERLASAERIPPGKIAIIPNGIAFRPPAPNARERGRRLLGVTGDQRAVIMIGRLEPVKNHELALRAFAQLPPELARVAKLCIVGAGSLDESLRALADALGLADSIAFMGFRSDALDLLAGADVMLMTSHNEAMPISLIEAMSAALPVATVPWAGAGEMLDDGALASIAPSYASADVACALAAVLSDPDRSRAKACAAREKARSEYDLRSVAARHAELYGTLVRPRA
jgi:glycosyltransferase involved in cell wall biosynthesis